MTMGRLLLLPRLRLPRRRRLLLLVTTTIAATTTTATTTTTTTTTTSTTTTTITTTPAAAAAGHKSRLRSSNIRFGDDFVQTNFNYMLGPASLCVAESQLSRPF